MGCVQCGGDRLLFFSLTLLLLLCPSHHAQKVLKKFNVRDVAYAWVDTEPDTEPTANVGSAAKQKQDKILQASFTMEGGQLLDELVATLISKFGQAGIEWNCILKESPLKVWVMDLQWKYPTKDHGLKEAEANGNRGRRVRVHIK